MTSNNAPEIVVLSGSKSEMGMAYGRALGANLKTVYGILIDYFVTEKKVPLSKVANRAELFFEKYPYSYQKFIEGMAEGANITLGQAKILNAMETLNSLLKAKPEIAACAFVAIPATKSLANSVLIGRNYDFYPPFDKCSQYLTVTIIKETDHVPTAFVGFAGQIFCPTCFNQNGLFAEFNNGMPSGGFQTDHSRESLLINLLEAMQNSASMNQLSKQLSALNSDYSLVVNTANSTHVQSFEYSAMHGMKSAGFVENEVVVSTNFFLNQNWNFSLPSDEACWSGHTRRDGLLQLSEAADQVTMESLQEMFDIDIDNGGGKWNYTLYQLVFDTASLELAVKMPKISDSWHNVDLDCYFNDGPDCLG